MITKASIRRFLWRHFPSLHEMIYDHFTEQEYQEMIDYIFNKKKAKSLFVPNMFRRPESVDRQGMK